MDKVAEEAITQAVAGDTRAFIELCFRVQPKVSEGMALVPLVFKPAQAEYWDNRSEADIILKAAQLGFTTLVQAEFLADAMFQPGLEVLYVAQRDDTAKRLFEITTRIYHAMPDELRPPAESDSTHMLKLKHSGGQSSTIEIGTAGSRSFGRGRPIHRALFTEIGFYERNEENVMAGIIARMPVGESRYVLESTANGQVGYFYEAWKGAPVNGLKPHFFPWWSEPEYRRAAGPLGLLSAVESFLKRNHGLDDAQLGWRRWMRGKFEREEFFQQEFPESPEQAFISTGGAVFSPEEVAAARLGVAPPKRQFRNGEVLYWQERQPGRRYVIGVDQASGEQVDSARSKPIDFQVASVWDVSGLAQVALVRGRISQRQLADHVAALHTYYNNALVVVERNLAQYGFFDMLREAGVHHLYYHSDGKAGYPVNSATKPLLVENFAEVLRAEGASLVRSSNLLAEMLTYQYQKHRGSRYMSAAAGSHDDELMSAMMAWDPAVRQRGMVAWRSAGRQGGYSKPRLIPIGV